MKKRALVLLVCLALVALVAVNGTLASEVQGLFQNLSNWFGETFGGPSVDTEALDVELVTSTSGVLTPAHYQGEFSFDAISENAIAHKYTCVKNVQAKDAYVRICIAVRNRSFLKQRLPSTPAGYVGHVQDDVTIGGQSFTLYTFDYTAALAQNKSTPVITMDFALAKETTNDDLADLGSDFVRVQSFAIEADAFRQLNEQGEKLPEDTTSTQWMSPHTALNNALGSIESFNPFR